MKQEVFKAHWKIYSVYTLIFLALSLVSFYYFFLFVPQVKAKNFNNSISGKFTQAQQDLVYIDTVISEWQIFVQGDITSKTERLNQIKNNFNELKEETEKYSDFTEVTSLYNSLSKYSYKGFNVTNNLEVIATYFKKVEKAVQAFNNLNTQTNDIEALKKLASDFKDVSNDALLELEKIEAPKVLLEIDKDYKDLLRQYVESADALLIAIEKNNLQEIEKVGKESDIRVAEIQRLLTEDLNSFSQSSSLKQDINLLKNLQKTIETELANLKTKYRM